MSSSQNPGHMTKVEMHDMKHIGTLPFTGLSSLRLCADAHRGKRDPHCIDIADAKHILYCASDVFPTLVAYVFGNPAMYPSRVASVTSAIMKSAMVIGYGTAPKQLCPVTIGMQVKG